MKREEYLNLKKELKIMASNLRFHKQEVKELQRNSDRRCFEAQSNLVREKLSARILHIFLSLARGRTREQIERNFNEQHIHQTYLENRIEKYCEEFGYEVDLDEYYRVISITQKVVEEVA